MTRPSGLVDLDALTGPPRDARARGCQVGQLLARLTEIGQNVLDRWENLIAPYRPAATGHTDDLAYCPRCASAWWIPAAMNINLDGKVTGYTYPVRCAECGHDHPPSGPIIGRVTGS